MTVQTVRGRLLASSMMGGLAAAIAMTSAPAFAQDDVAIEEIVVTGSRIRRAEIETSAPVAVVSAQTLTDRGVVQVGDMLNQISSNVPSFAIADGASPEQGGGGDDEPPIARSQVVHEIVAGDSGQLEHLDADGGGGGHVGGAGTDEPRPRLDTAARHREDDGGERSPDAPAESGHQA